MILTPEEEEFIQAFATGLTGHSFAVQSNLETVFRNVKTLMMQKGAQSLADYLAVALDNDEALDELISALTIHTTNWFRESPHFELLSKDLQEKISQKSEPSKIKILVAACSTGQEAYSVAFTCLQVLNRLGPKHQLEITAFDLDPVCVKKARAGMYSYSEMRTIPKEYHGYLTVDAHQEKFTVREEVKRVCTFKTGNLLKLEENSFYDYILCRNALIYFTVDKVAEIVKSLSTLLAPSGKLVLGHSDNLVSVPVNVRPLRNNVYENISGSRQEKKQQKNGTTENVKDQKLTQLYRHSDAILIGSSTGGTTALVDLLQGLGPQLPAVVVVQHISHQFSQDFASRLADSSGLRLETNPLQSILKPQTLYMSVGDYHLGLKGRKGDLRFFHSDDPALRSHRPSVDFLFHSAAKLHDLKFFCMILTGMGEDGARGLLELRKAGHFTSSQDEVSSTVYGMPKVAAELGASQFIGNIHELRELLISTFPKRENSQLQKLKAS